MNNEDLRSRYRRDYTNEPISARQPARQPKPDPNLSTKQPAPAAEGIVDSIKSPEETLNSNAKMANRKPRRKFFKRVIAGVIFIILVLSAGAGIYHFKIVHSLIPDNIKSQANLPILYPAKLPAGYKIIKSSFSISQSKIIAYYASDQADNHINFTVQPRPNNFDFDKFYSEAMTNTTKVSTPLGEAVVGTASGHLLGSLASTKSWLLVTGSSDKIGADKLQTALSSVKVVN